MSTWPVQMLIYAAGDGNARFSPLDTFIRTQVRDLEVVVTNRHVNGILQLDNTSGESERWVLGSARNSTYERIGETNTGDPNELVSFCQWAGLKCPSDRMILVLSGHGVAWQDQLVRDILRSRGLLRGDEEPPPAGVIKHASRLFGSRGTPVSLGSDATATIAARAVLIDANARNGAADFLDNTELARACERIAPLRSASATRIETLVFDACLMSSVEVLFELKPSVQTVVAAMDEISAKGMNLSGAAQLITDLGGLLTSRELAAAFPETYIPMADTDSCIAVDLQSEAFDGAVRKFSEFAGLLLASMTTRMVVRDVMDRIQLSLRLTRFSKKNVSDLTSLQRAFRTFADSTAAVERLNEAVDLFSKAVIKRTTGREYEDVLGLSVYVPPDRNDYTFNQPDYSRLRFGPLTKWNDVLGKAFGATA